MHMHATRITDAARTTRGKQPQRGQCPRECSRHRLLCIAVSALALTCESCQVDEYIIGVETRRLMHRYERVNGYNGRLSVCENSDGWLVAWGLCECMLIRFSTVWLLPKAFTLL